MAAILQMTFSSVSLKIYELLDLKAHKYFSSASQVCVQYVHSTSRRLHRSDEFELAYLFHVVTKQVSHLGGCFCAFDILVVLVTKQDLVAVVYMGSLYQQHWKG